LFCIPPGPDISRSDGTPKYEAGRLALGSRHLTREGGAVTGEIVDQTGPRGRRSFAVSCCVHVERGVNGE